MPQFACDNAAANRLTIHILAAVAEDEARRISERTKVALAAAKARGQLLGSARPDHWTGREDSRLAGLAKGREVARVAKRVKAMAGVPICCRKCRRAGLVVNLWRRLPGR